MKWCFLCLLFLTGCFREVAEPKTQQVPTNSLNSKLVSNHERLLQLNVKMGELKRHIVRMEKILLKLQQHHEEKGQKIATKKLPKLPAFAGKNEEPWTPKQKSISMEIIKELIESKEKGTMQDELINKKFPIVRFLRSDGELIELSEYRNKKIVLVVLRGFAGSVCLVCSSQTLALSRSVEKFKKRNAQIILVYPGKAESVPGFLEAVNDLQQGFTPPFPIALDIDLSLVNTFKINGDLAKPTTLIIDEQNTVRFASVGKDPGDRPSVKTLLEELDKIS